jgi:CheY-like chemotaxis protein
VGRAFGRDLDTSIDRELELANGRIVLVRAVPVRGDHDGMVVALRDVSERVALQAQLEQGRRLAAIGRIAGGIAHEVNNPLTVLQLRADLLVEEGELSDYVRRQVELIRESTRRIVRTVSSLQRVSRPTLPDPEPVAVETLVAASVGGAREVLPEALVEVEPVDPSARVRGDAEALRLAVEQLVLAAAGEGPASVRVSTSGRRARIEVAVARGAWPEGVLPDPTASTEAQLRVGGIGLALAGTIASDHGGEVRVSRRYGGGGVLTLELPLASSAHAPRSAPARILVVDDEPLVASVLVDFCRRAGHTVDVAQTAEEVMDRVGRGEAWDAILADDQLPGTSGQELIAWLARAQPGLARRAALMSGGLPEVGERPFLPKPFTRRQLSELMAALLAR